MVEVSAEELAEPAGRTAEMPDQITVTSSSTDAAQLACGTHAPVDGQDRAVTSIREQFNPLGVGLRSIWPQSVCGY
ncbi:hypothetical protein [Paenarthrobacter ureafaciens]|uniref:hypothetical protein n=1 Tax=Paenarthrobacter ureafaciens TaxID=37931 RepID=UPI001FB21224|nr:hypothetical protein [Paenarthrobacter ureafaciens]UOD81085.1 hypothetical protein MQZ73_18580 [Paenarthrobacter ureafaciens]WNZ03744.1 hypothetical protein PVT25_19235 [Paenarthrobacter ureafaciens]